MGKFLSPVDFDVLSTEFNLEKALIKAVVAVESGGKGFDSSGKIIIQFEPAWFKRKAPYTPSGKWSLNKVEVQYKEWEAFNDAYAKNANAAMESTSIGLMQVMGFHYKLLGFSNVGAMWEFAKESEINQLRLGLRFIKSNKKMYDGLKAKNFSIFAYYYNGEQYKKFNYDTRMLAAYNKSK